MTTQQDRAELIRKLHELEGSLESWGLPVSMETVREAAALLAAHAGGGEAVAEVKENPYCPEGMSDELTKYLPVGTLLYTHPQQAAQVPLTEDQIAAAMTGQKETGVAFKHVIQITRAVEAAHGIGKDQA